MLFLAALSSMLGVATVSPILIGAMFRDETIRSCASQSAAKPGRYVAGAFDIRTVILRSGQTMIVAIARDPCLALGQSTRLLIFEKNTNGYRRVLDEPTLPDFAVVGTDGTATLPTHESMEVIFEATYLWNGSRYAFSPLRSHEYDVALSERRPYARSVHFRRGESAVTLKGTVALNFGDTYAFNDVAGERATIALASYAGRRPIVSLHFENETPPIAELGGSSIWSGRLPKRGTYYLLVLGTDERDETRRSSYAIRLSLQHYSSGGATGAGALRAGGWSSVIDK